MTFAQAALLIVFVGVLSYVVLTIVLIVFIAGAERRRDDEDVNRAHRELDDVDGCS